MLAGAAAAAITFDAHAQSQSRTLNFLNWDTYIGETTLEDFRAATGIGVHVTLFASSDELMARLERHVGDFDVIVPSNETVMRLRDEGLLQRLDHSKIPNIANLDPGFLDPPFDPGLACAMPYTWLLWGIAYNKNRVRETPTWRDVLDSGRYSGRISLPGESDTLARLYARYLGHSVNGISEPMLADIERLLKRQRPRLHRFHADDGQDMLYAHEVDLVVEYNGDIAYLQREIGGDEIGFVVPEQGSIRTCDLLAIPAAARNVEAAHAFINFMLDAEAGRRITETILYPTPNRAARDLMPAAYRESETLFPAPEVLARCEYPVWEGQAQAYRFEEMFVRATAS